MPCSPLIGPTPCLYPSLHSSESLSYEDEPEVHPVAKRVLFAPDLSRHGDEPEEEEERSPSANHSLMFEGEEREPFPLSEEASEGSVTSEAHFPSNTRLDQALEHEDILEAQSVVVSLKGLQKGYASCGLLSLK